jgi:hypothetical protein
MMASGLGVPLEMNLDALREEALAAPLAATGKDGSAILGLHAGAESKLALARALRGLIGAFHKAKEVEVFGKKERQDSGSNLRVNG